MYPFVESPKGSWIIMTIANIFFGTFFMFSLLVNLVFEFFCHLHIDVEMREKKKVNGELANLKQKDEKNKWFLGKFYHDILIVLRIIIIIIRNANFFLYQVPINLAKNIKGCPICF